MAFHVQFCGCPRASAQFICVRTFIQGGRHRRISAVIAKLLGAGARLSGWHPDRGVEENAPRYAVRSPVSEFQEQPAAEAVADPERGIGRSQSQQGVKMLLDRPWRIPSRESVTAQVRRYDVKAFRQTGSNEIGEPPAVRGNPVEAYDGGCSGITPLVDVEDPCVADESRVQC